MTTHPPISKTLTERWKEYTLSQKTDLRTKLIDAVACHEGWEESAIAMVEETIMPIIRAQAIADSSLIDRLTEIRDDLGATTAGIKLLITILKKKLSLDYGFICKD